MPTSWAASSSHQTKIRSSTLDSHRPMPTCVFAWSWSSLIGPKTMSPSPLSVRIRLVLCLRRSFGYRPEGGIPNSSPSRSECGRPVASIIWAQPSLEAPPFGLDAAAGLQRIVCFLLHENTTPRRRDRLWVNGLRYSRGTGEKQAALPLRGASILVAALPLRGASIPVAAFALIPVF